MLKDDITRLAKGLGIKYHHIEKLLDGTYTSIWLSNTQLKGRSLRVCLALKDNQKHKTVLKTVKADNKAVVSKMIDLVRLVRLDRLEEKTESRKTQFLRR